VQPVFFEIITGQSIQKFLLNDFPAVFREEDAAVLFLAAEASSPEEATATLNQYEQNARQLLAEKNLSSSWSRSFTTALMDPVTGYEAFEHFKKPREELPKRLRTKCKTDMEIRAEYLPQVIELVEQARPRAMADRKVDVLFGHLTPNHTAIMHWNIGGFDLYDEEQSDVAWDYLEKVIGKAQALAPEGDPYGSARFTGEHGVAGKAPFLWLNYIPKDDFERMCRVKDILDPQDLFNPETLFLRTSVSRALRARLIAFGTQKLQKMNLNEVERYVAAESLRCTRCNSCKICPVIDAEQELEAEGKRNSKSPILPSKRNVLMFMEKTLSTTKNAEATLTGDALKKVQLTTSAMFAESAALLKKCFYCRKCDKACPVNIDIHPLVRAYHKMGNLRPAGSKLWGFLYERLMGEDSFKSFTYRLFALGTLLGQPVFQWILKFRFLPHWLKTYLSPPTLSLAHYEPRQHGLKLDTEDNFTVVSKSKQTQDLRVMPHVNQVFVRYRGCMDTFGNPAATTSVDGYFKSVLGATLVDLEKKMCCGFPFEADGLHERAVQSQLVSMVEIAKCIQGIRALPETSKAKITVFSNCPTCCEAIKEMSALLAEPEKLALVVARAKLPPGTSKEWLQFAVKDTAELAVELLEAQAMHDPKGIEMADSNFREVDLTPTKPLLMNKTVGLKVPCHNTPAATETQLKLLRMYYTGVQSYDRCCGLSGTGRLKHPKIGTKISEKLFEQILENPPQVVVSGCPSCRDGVKIQRNILVGEGQSEANFGISGIFEQIQKDFSKSFETVK
jgi:Fe-S oxidoreductase